MAQGGRGEAGANTNNYYDIAADTGDAPYTRRQRFLSTFGYDLRFGAGARRARGPSAWLLSGWRLTGITLVQSGPHLTPYFTAGDPSGTNPSSRSIPQQRPDVVAGVSAVPALQTPARWFDSAAFRIPLSRIGRFGQRGHGHPDRTRHRQPVALGWRSRLPSPSASACGPKRRCRTC